MSTLKHTRVSIITRVHFQLPDTEAQGPLYKPYFELLSTEEQPYQRTVKVEESWKKLDFGWTQENGCSFLHIRNNYSVKRIVEPSEDERAEDMAKVIEIGVQIPPKLIPTNEMYIKLIMVLYVGQESVISPMEQDDYYVRCRYGEGQYSVFCIAANDSE